MPHSAVLVERVERVPITVVKRHPGAPGYEDKTYAHATRAFVWRAEPASVSNPIRKDGTRAPSAYYIHSVVFAQRSAKNGTSPPVWGWWIPGPQECDPWNDMGFGNPNVTLAAKDIQSRLHSSWLQWRVDDRARVALLNKLADASKKDEWSFGVFAGEFRESVHLASDLAGRLVGCVKNISRQFSLEHGVVANVLSVYGSQGPKAALKQLGSTDTGLLQSIVEAYLVYQFGMKPLFNDLVTANSLLTASVDPGNFPDPYFEAVIRGGAEDSTTSTIHCGHAWAEGLGMDCYAKVVETLKVSYSCRYKIPLNPTLPEKLGLYNPALVAWNLTRFSWMADYVTDTSEWLRSLIAGQRCQFLEGSCSSVARANVVSGYSVEALNGPVAIDPMKSAVLFHSLRFDRTVVTGGVFPPLLPSFKFDLGVSQLANSIAALTTLVGSRTRSGPPIINF